MRIKNFILLLIFSISLLASGGSVYTRYGIGEIKHFSSAREAGLAGSGISLLRTDNLSRLNPASWGAIEITRFNASLSFTGYDMSSSTNSAFYSETDFSGFLIGIPISNQYGISLAAGLQPYSNVNYEVFTENESDELGPYSVDYSGEGGLSKVFFGLSYKLPFDLRLGASFEYFNGNTEYLTGVQFDRTTDFHDTQYELSLKTRGVGYTLGLISPDFSKYFDSKEFSDLRIGLTYNIIPPLNVDSVLSADNSIGFNELTDNGFEREIPNRLGIGLSFTWKENYTFLFDYVNQDFSQYSVNGAKSSNLRQLNRFSLGFEYRHSSGRFGSTWEQMIFRAGLSFEETPYVVNGDAIDELAVFGGFSFPMGVDNSLDFGFKYGIRGTTDNSLIKENIFAVYFTLNFGDLWFVRPDR